MKIIQELISEMSQDVRCNQPMAHFSCRNKHNMIFRDARIMGKRHQIFG